MTYLARSPSREERRERRCWCCWWPLLYDGRWIKVCKSRSLYQSRSDHTTSKSKSKRSRESFPSYCPRQSTGHPLRTVSRNLVLHPMHSELLLQIGQQRRQTVRALPVHWNESSDADRSRMKVPSYLRAVQKKATAHPQPLLRLDGSCRTIPP